jgi:hypothetical protein
MTMGDQPGMGGMGNPPPMVEIPAPPVFETNDPLVAFEFASRNGQAWANDPTLGADNYPMFDENGSPIMDANGNPLMGHMVYDGNGEITIGLTGQPVYVVNDPSFQGEGGDVPPIDEILAGMPAPEPLPGLGGEGGEGIGGPGFTPPLVDIPEPDPNYNPGLGMFTSTDDFVLSEPVVLLGDDGNPALDENGNAVLVQMALDGNGDPVLGPGGDPVLVQM